MLRGLWKLTWIEIKIFLREPLGAFGTMLSLSSYFSGWAASLGGRLHRIRARRQQFHSRRACRFSLRF